MRSFGLAAGCPFGRKSENSSLRLTDYRGWSAPCRLNARALIPGGFVSGWHQFGSLQDVLRQAGLADQGVGIEVNPSGSIVNLEK